MPETDAALPFEQALTHLQAGAYTEALGLFAAQADGPEPTREAARLGTSLCHALSGQWEAALSDLPGSEDPGEGALPVALRAVALTLQEPSEEALRAGLEAAYRPAAPLPLVANPEWAALGRWYVREGGPALRRAVAGDEAPDPFGQALLALVDPEPARGASTLQAAVEAGLDLPPILAALARLHRLAGDRDACRRALDRAANDELDDELGERIARERQACDRDAELDQALRVVLRRGNTERVLRRSAGLYLTLHEEPTARGWVHRLDAAQTPGALRHLVNDHLDAGWEVTDWTLDGAGDEADVRLAHALEDGRAEQALRLGRLLMQRRPTDAALVARLLPASVALRGPQATLPLSQRVLVLADEPGPALLDHAALLFEAGALVEGLGVLYHLEETHGPEELGPAGHALLTRHALAVSFRPGVASQRLQQAAALFGDHPVLREAAARLAFWQGDYGPSLDLLAPLLASGEASADTYALALQAHLEGELEGRQKTLAEARKRWPAAPLIQAAGHEHDGRAGLALKAYHAARTTAPGSLSALEAQLYALRAAPRLSAFEEGLQLARETQTRLGTPDPRCLKASYTCLTALEPGEDREDLAEMAKEAAARAAAVVESVSERRQAMLSAGLYLDPSALEVKWAEWTGPATDAATGDLPEASADLPDALICCATTSGCVTLFDTAALADRLTQPPWDWYTDAERLSAELDAERLGVAPVDPDGVVWIRFGSRPPTEHEAPRYRQVSRGHLRVPSGQLFVGPGEALLASPEADLAPAALAVELGGGHRLIPPGRYPVSAWVRTPEPWPSDDVRSDPCDVIFQLG